MYKYALCSIYYNSFKLLILTENVANVISTTMNLFL